MQVIKNKIKKMKKTLLTERFQQLAGLKPLYELDLDKARQDAKLHVGKEVPNPENPEDLKRKLASAKDKIENHPLLQKAIDKVANSPRLFKLLQKVANKFGIVNLNENQGDIDLDAIINTAVKNKDKINEGDADGGLVFGAMFGLPMLATLLPPELFDALMKMIPGYGGSKMGFAAMASLLLGLVVVGVARRIKGGNLTEPDKEGGM